VHPSPTVVSDPGHWQCFSFGKTKIEARITGEFYTNAVHVMEGATATRRRRQAEGAPSSRARRVDGSLRSPFELCGIAAVRKLPH